MTAKRVRGRLVATMLAAVTGDHDQWQAEVNHPKGAKFVSLRAGAADRQGGSVKHTIIRAYALT